MKNETQIDLQAENSNCYTLFTHRETYTLPYTHTYKYIGKGWMWCAANSQRPASLKCSRNNSLRKPKIETITFAKIIIVLKIIVLQIFYKFKYGDGKM